MAGCPYDSFPPSAWWRPSLVEKPFTSVEPITTPPFQVSPTDRVATAGSCFAQEIARYIKASGYTFLDAEPGPARLTDEEREQRQYGLFSARYGNIYTTRQLLQLLQRSYGTFAPAEDHWTGSKDGFFDPFRPSVEPGGYSTLDELRWDRERHFLAVRTLVESADVFVFTLGLTECWRSKEDGATYPVCPGCGYGSHDPAKHEPYNLRVSDVVGDLNEIHAILKARNPGLRLILTVSPVPLIATMSGEHVLTATTYSKSVLRAAAGEFCAGKSDVCYFPSFEIVTGQYARGAYFADNLRTVTRAGVDHVMRCFFKMFSGGLPSSRESQPHPEAAASGTSTQAKKEAGDIFSLICDEEELQRRYESSRD